MDRFLESLRRLLAGALVGAQLFFAGVAAQQAFPRAVAALPPGHPRRLLAAELVGAMLSRLDAATLALSALAALLALRARRGRAAVVLPALASLCAGTSAVLVTPALQALRVAGETTSARFGALHGASALLLLAELVSLAVAALLP